MDHRRRDFLALVAAAAMPLVAGRTSLAALASLNPDLTKQKTKVDPLDAYFERGPLPRLRIELDPTEMETLDANQKATVRAQVFESAPGEPDRQYCDVGLHLKGSFGSRRPVTDRPALTLNFDKFVDGQNFHGLDKVHLNNSVQDASHLCENLGGWIFRESGVPAPRASAARVWLNARDLGVYGLKEGFDGPFLKRYFGNRTGNLYESDFADVDRQLPIHLGERKPTPPVNDLDPNAVQLHEEHLDEVRLKAWARLRELAVACRVVDAEERHRRIERVLDLDRFLTFLACETMVAHWDGYATNRNNYRIYDDPKSGKLVFLPHGMDQLFQRPEHSLYGNNSVLPLALTINNPADRKRYLDRVAEVRRGAFRTDALLAQLARMDARISPLFDELGVEAVADHMARVAKLRKRIQDRCAAIDRQLVTEPKPLKFDDAGVASLDDWWPMIQDDGGDSVTDRVDAAGKPCLRVTCNPPGGGTGSWRSSQLLTPGVYTFSGRMKLTDVSTRRVVASSLGGTGACLRISGSRRSTRFTGTTEWQVVTYSFSVTTAIKEVTCICELSAGSGEALFDLASLKLHRQKRAVNRQEVPLRLQEP